jgi:holin-like protein
MPHGDSYGELVLCGIFVIVFLMYFGLLFRKRWYILVPKKKERKWRIRGIMKYVRQFLIILVISFIGELLRYYIPLKIPASIYGLVLLFAALELRIIKLESICETSRFLIEIMPLMFVPAGVGLLSSWGVLKPVCVPIMVIVLISTIIVMAVSGKVTQGVIRMEKKHPKKKNGADHIYVKDSEGERQYISENSI